MVDGGAGGFMGVFIAAGWWVFSSEEEIDQGIHRTLTSWQVLIDEATAKELIEGLEESSLANRIPKWGGVPGGKNTYSFFPEPKISQATSRGYVGPGEKLRAVLRAKLAGGNSVQIPSSEVQFRSIQPPVSSRHMGLVQRLSFLWDRAWKGTPDEHLHAYGYGNWNIFTSDQKPLGIEVHLQGSVGATYRSRGEIEFQAYNTQLRLDCSHYDAKTRQLNRSVSETVFGWEQNLKAGEGVRILTRDPENTSGTSVLLTVFERIDFSQEAGQYGYFRDLKPWIEGGPERIETVLKKASLWRRATASQKFPEGEEWRRELGDGMSLTLLGVSRPLEGPMLWWNPNGVPVSMSYPNQPGPNWSLDHLLSGYWDAELRGLLLVRWKPKGEFLEAARARPPGSHANNSYHSQVGFGYLWGPGNTYFGPRPQGVTSPFDPNYVAPPLPETETGFVCVPGKLMRDAAGKLTGKIEVAVGIGEWEAIGNFPAAETVARGGRKISKGGSSSTSSGSGWVETSQSFRLELKPMEEARFVAVTADGKKVLGRSVPTMYAVEEEGKVQVTEGWGVYPGLSNESIDHFEVSVRPLKVVRFENFTVEMPKIAEGNLNQP